MEFLETEERSPNRIGRQSARPIRYLVRDVYDATNDTRTSDKCGCLHLGAVVLCCESATDGAVYRYDCTKCKQAQCSFRTKCRRIIFVFVVVVNGGCCTSRTRRRTSNGQFAIHVEFRRIGEDDGILHARRRQRQRRRLNTPLLSLGGELLVYYSVYFICCTYQNRWR